MTFGIPGRAASGSVPSARTAPLARISRSALELNLRAVLSSSADGIVDVRADAWGHGLEFVATMALSEGAQALMVDETGVARLAGAVEPARLVSAGASADSQAVYGLTPGFAPVLSLVGVVLSCKVLRAGEGVSYGYTHRATRDTVVALVTGGYAQGVVRSLGNAATVRVGQERHPIVGRVAMDVCVIDVGPLGAVDRGDEVVFFGDPVSDAPAVAEWAAATGLQAAELVTAVGLRNDREYVR
ncbi:alanine racemase C-terminal domain-containing protein [uncultured Microbacterium sp.]|uniref:alanine racemase C-terminal domain-containing protein n=1 Tax=uncultured Microbacterium sp. TaxID=191216 RepID=UPI0028D6899A|nr:alanine racemase C-terminal domain-containing protein [uncultured Microbacterium sp.]